MSVLSQTFATISQALWSWVGISEGRPLRNAHPRMAKGRMAKGSRGHAKGERHMIVCPAVCWSSEGPVMAGGFGGNSYSMIFFIKKEERWTKDPSYIIHQRSFYARQKKKWVGGHCEKGRRDGVLTLFSQGASLQLSSHPLSPGLLSCNAILIQRQTNPFKALPSHGNAIPPCLSLPANPSCLLFLFAFPPTSPE